MRMPLIALIPAALLAGAAYAQSEPQAAEPPAEAVEAQEQDTAPQQEEPAQDAEVQEGDEEEAPPPPEVIDTEVSGTWERTNGAGRDTVSYVSNEGETLFSATCMTADTEYGDRIMQIKAASAEDNIGAIDIFTSAGNARLPAAPDMNPDIATGMTEPVSRPTYVLASGAGDLRIVSGSRGTVFETDPMLKDVIRTCHPDPATVREAAEEAKADAEASADADTDAVEEATDSDV